MTTYEGKPCPDCGCTCYKDIEGHPEYVECEGCLQSKPREEVLTGMHMKPHLAVNLEYNLEEIAKKIGRPLTDNEVGYLERKLPSVIDNEIGEGLYEFITQLIEVWVE